MKDDPHETAERLSLVAKDPRTEELLTAMNERLADAVLPAPQPSASDRRLPLIYVVGIPRSGTTILAQLLCRHLPLGYIDNLSARFWRRPSVGIALSKSILGPWGSREIALESRHGVTSGAQGPHEFGYFWRFWLRLDAATTHHLSNEQQQRLDHAGLTRALEAEILQSVGGPTLLRNPICGFHGNLLTELHPNSLFVWIRRSPLETARSILRCRMERFGSYAAWWSLKPSTWPFDGVKDPAEEVTLQVLECCRELEQELPKSAATLHLDYEALCEDPWAALQLVRDRVECIGYPMRIVGEVPKRLRVPSSADRLRATAPLPDELERCLVGCFEEHVSKGDG
jgi:hypothetical protein